MTDPLVHLPHPSVTAEKHGAKARWLNWLLLRGYPVPPCFCVPKTTTPPGREWLSPIRAAVDGLDPRRARPDRTDTGTGSQGHERYELAIRSSAPAEDHRSESTAGVFESELGSFTVEEVLDAIARVVESGPRDVPVGVVVQRLVRPRFSGLAHSSHPVTGNRRETVVTWTDGRAEDLTSGRTAGALTRCGPPRVSGRPPASRSAT